MATNTIAAGKVAAHAVTLTASTVETFTFTDNIGKVDVISDGAAAVYYTVDGTTPTIGGANCFLMPAGGPAVDTRKLPTAASDTVKLISVGTPIVSVQSAD